MKNKKLQSRPVAIKEKKRAEWKRKKNEEEEPHRRIEEKIEKKEKKEHTWAPGREFRSSEESRVGGSSEKREAAE